MKATTLEPSIRPTPSEDANVARAAGLSYVKDGRPGIRRERAGKAFRYLASDGSAILDPSTLARIRKLAIPPAWDQVWISPSERGHLQATGRDERGRKQYRYHIRWREVRDGAKFERMTAFGGVLSQIREEIDRELARSGLTRRKVLAAVVHLLELSLIRVGNDEYAKSNRSFGLTTLLDRHVGLEGASIRFKFRGKSGVHHEINIHDRRLANIVRRCQELPGQELFQYLDDDGEVRDINSAHVNEYLQEITGRDFTAKDFRTWAGTVLAFMALQEFEAFDSQAQAKKNISRAIEHVAKRLGNTPTVCRNCYIHPLVLDAYLDGSIIAVLQQRAAEEMNQSLGSLKPEEAAVLALLQNRLSREKAVRTKSKHTHRA